MFDPGKRRLSFPDLWRGKVIGGRGKGVHFDLGELLDGEVGEELVLRSGLVRELVRRDEDVPSIAPPGSRLDYAQSKEHVSSCHRE